MCVVGRIEKEESLLCAGHIGSASSIRVSKANRQNVFFFFGDIIGKDISHLLRKVWGLNTNPKVRLSSSYLFPVVFVSLQHGHPRPCRGELSKHVHGDARPARDEDADVVRFQIRSNFHRFGERGSSFDDILLRKTHLTTTTRFGLQGGRQRPRRVVVEGRERTRHSFLCCRSVLTSRDVCV